MSLVQEGYQIARSRPCRPDISSLRREWLSARREWLLQASTWASLHVARKRSEDDLDLLCSSRQRFLDDVLAEQANLRQAERALRHMLEASYGVCRECRTDILLFRLRCEPWAVFCKECIEERLELLAADAL